MQNAPSHPDRRLMESNQGEGESEPKSGTWNSSGESYFSAFMSAFPSRSPKSVEPSAFEISEPLGNENGLDLQFPEVSEPKSPFPSPNRVSSHDIRASPLRFPTSNRDPFPVPIPTPVSRAADRIKESPHHQSIQNPSDTFISKRSFSSMSDSSSSSSSGILETSSAPCLAVLPLVAHVVLQRNLQHHSQRPPKSCSASRSNNEPVRISHSMGSGMKKLSHVACFPNRHLSGYAVASQILRLGQQGQ
jgi:hypothetical protein